MYKGYIRKIVVVINCLIIFFMIYTITSSAAYTVLVGDDFVCGVHVNAFNAFNVPLFQYLITSWQYMKGYYFDWQGTYFALFIQPLLSPINHFGLIQLRVVMICNAILFFAGLFGACQSASGYILKEKKELPIRLTIFTAILFAILDSNIFEEIFFWYTGAMVYTVPFSVLLFSVMFFLMSNNGRHSRKKKCMYTICSAVMLFLASGGSLAVAGTGCYTVLLLTVGFLLVSKKISAGNIIVTASGIVGALINVAAPGNYARRSYGNGSSWELLKTVKWTVRIVWEEVEHVTKETMFGVILIAMLLIGIYLSDKLRPVIKEYGIISVLALGTAYVTTFPVILGYGGATFGNRCYFILDVVLVFSLFNFAIFAGCCLDMWADLRTNKSAWAILCIILFSVFLLGPEEISDSALVTIAKAKRNGTYKNYYEECVSVYQYLETCPEEDVVIRMPSFIENFECFFFDDDETGWVNVALAEYYHKNSVKRKNE